MYARIMLPTYIHKYLRKYIIYTRTCVISWWRKYSPFNKFSLLRFTISNEIRYIAHSQRNVIHQRKVETILILSLTLLFFFFLSYSTESRDSGWARCFRVWQVLQRRLHYRVALCYQQSSPAEWTSCVDTRWKTSQLRNQTGWNQVKNTNNRTTHA